MAANLDRSMADHLTRVQLGLLQQKLAEEKLKARSPTFSPNALEDTEKSIRLQKALLRRQELLDQLKEEQVLNRDMQRSRSQQEWRIPTPGNPVPQYHMVEHQVRPHHLDPLIHQVQPVTPPIAMPSTVVHPIPQPVIMPDQPRHGSKGEFMEMMMMQNAQMHQMMMQQMMLSALPKNNNTPDPSIPLTLATELLTKRRPPSVHHHHYSPREPVISHYTHLPPINVKREPSPRTKSPQQYQPIEVRPARAGKIQTRNHRVPNTPVSPMRPTPIRVVPGAEPDIYVTSL